MPDYAITQIIQSDGAPVHEDDVYTTTVLGAKNEPAALADMGWEGEVYEVREMGPPKRVRVTKRNVRVSVALEEVEA